MAKTNWVNGESVAASDLNSLGTDVNNKQPLASKNQPNGYAGLDGSGKLSFSQLPTSAMEYKGSWNASTNTPTLADGTGNTGDFYRVSTGATRNLGSGAITFTAGDDVLYNGSTWEKVPGATGVVGITRSIATISTTVTLGAAASTDYVYFLNSGAVPTLPTAVGNSNRYSIKNIHTADRTISTTSSQTIDGSTTLVLIPAAAVDLVSDGANWRVF